MNRRQRIRRKIWWHGEAWSDAVLDWQEVKAKSWITSDRLFSAVTPHDGQGWASRWICRLLRAHYAIEDHCGKPEHDVCLFCEMSTPNGAKAEREERLRRWEQRLADRR